MRNRLASAGLILALAAILFHWRGFGYDEFRRPFVILGAALVLAAGAGLGRSGAWMLRISDLALLALVVSAFFAVNPADAGAALFPPVVAWIFLRATALGWISRPFLEQRGLQLLSILGIAFAGYGLCQRLGGDFLGFGRGTTLAVSTISNTTYSGVLSAALALAGLAAAVFERGLARRITGGAAALLCGLHVAASGSLGGLAGLGAGAVAFAVFLVRRHGWKPVAVIPFLILAAAIVPVASRLSARIGEVVRGEDRTSRIRLGLWKGTLRLSAAHPVFGCGAGSFRAEFPPFRDA